MDLFNFTVATQERGYLNALKESCKINGLNLKIVGMGQKWEGFGTKLRLIRETLDQLNSDTVVLYSDAYDSIIIGTAEDILKRFRQFNSDIVFSSTNQSGVNKVVFGDACDSVKNKSLDAGCFIGRAGALKLLFDSICAKTKCSGDIDDQKIINGWCQKHKIHLDVDNALFYAFDWSSVIKGYTNMLLGRPSDVLALETKYYSFRNKKFLVHKTNARPIILHANGNANMDNIVKAYGMKAVNIPKNYFKYSTWPLIKGMVFSAVAILIVGRIIFLKRKIFRK